MCQYMTITSLHIQLQAKFREERGNVSQKIPDEIIFMWFSSPASQGNINKVVKKSNFGTPNYEFINKYISQCEHSTADWTCFARCLYGSFSIRIGGGLIPQQPELSSLWQQGDLRRRTDKLKPAGLPKQRCWCRVLTSDGNNGVINKRRY